MKILDEVKLFLLTQGVKPEILEQVAGAADSIVELVQTATERNHAQATAAWIQSASMLTSLAEKVKPHDSEQGTAIANLATQALKNAAVLLANGESAEPEVEPAQA